MSMNKKRGIKLASLSLAAALSCGLLAGCAQLKTNSQKDMAQVVAEVDISRGQDFAEGQPNAKYQDVINASQILKSDLISNFLSYGYQYVQSYGQTYEQAFTTLKDNLVNREMLLQYAMVELFNEGTYKEQTFNVEGYSAAIKDKSGTERDLAGVGYFLSETEKEKALYTLRASLNASLDSQEKSFIKEDEREYMTDVRTTPTGIDTQNEDYVDKAYRVYTGRNAVLDCGSYEAVEGSTPSSRKKAYNQFLGNLLQNNLLFEGEDTSKLEELSYFKAQMVVAYEDALQQKLVDLFEERAVKDLTEQKVVDAYNQTLSAQKNSYQDVSAFETALDSASETSFVLTAPSSSYGYVINILLPFSETQKADLTRDTASLTENEKFAKRAEMLNDIRATDQRESWLNGETDRSFEKDGKYYFFENSLTDTARYEKLKNYAGTYAFNGEVTKNDEKADERYTVKANKITIDGFIAEMETQLKSVAGEDKVSGAKTATYATSNFYKNDNQAEGIDYDKFVYYTGKADLGTVSTNDIFCADSTANKAMSVINELSFAYNTDTAGLNKYLGYAVSAYKTSFVPEFEVAAKQAVAGGVGSYTVAPSEYGWHIMYCTFKFDMNANGEVYSFVWGDIEKEGCFSNLYYESLKSTAISSYSNSVQTKITNGYSSCVTLYEDRYDDLFDLDKQ